ncbi:MAG: YfhO family protein, partial [Patescibacteria group bacterium]
SLSVLAAYGLNNYSKKIRFIPLLLIFILIISIIYLKFYLILPRDFMVALKNVILPFGFLAAFFVLTFIKSKKLFLILIFFLTIFGQYYFFNKYLSLGEKEFLYPNNQVFSYLQNNQNNYERFIALDKPIFGNFATMMKVYSPEGFDPIFSKRYGQLVAAAKNSPVLERIEVTMSEPIATNSATVKKLLSLLGVKNILRYQNNEWQFTRNESALPRAFLVNNYIVETDSQKILDKIFDPNIDLSKTVILEEEPNIKIASGQAKMTTYEPTKVVVNTNSSENNLLFLSDNYYPGWKAYVNNIETKIYRADFSFRAVPVPAGDNTVIFQYDPMSLKIGAIISILTLCGLALLFYLRRYLRS